MAATGANRSPLICLVSYTHVPPPDAGSTGLTLGSPVGKAGLDKGAADADRESRSSAVSRVSGTSVQPARPCDWNNGELDSIADRLFLGLVPGISCALISIRLSNRSDVDVGWLLPFSSSFAVSSIACRSGEGARPVVEADLVRGSEGGCAALVGALYISWTRRNSRSFI